MMKSNSDVAPVDLSNQPQVLTDDEIDKVAGGVTAMEYGLINTTAIGAVNERLAVGKGMIDVSDAKYNNIT